MALAPVRVVSSLILSSSLVLKNLRGVAAVEGNADVYSTLRLVLNLGEKVGILNITIKQLEYLISLSDS